MGWDEEVKSAPDVRPLLYGLAAAEEASAQRELKRVGLASPYSKGDGSGIDFLLFLFFFSELL